MGPFIEFELEIPEEFIDQLKTHLEDEIRQGIVEISAAVGTTAKLDHPWQNRSGDLQASTAGSNVVWGDLWNDSLEGEVLGETEYGEYLEELNDGKWAWLKPAWETTEAENEGSLDRAMQRGADEAGWGAGGEE